MFFWTVTVNEYSVNPMPDEIPYGSVFEALRGLFDCTGVAESEPLNWAREELVRFFKRLGSIPRHYNRRRAALRVLLASKEMAHKGGVELSEVYRLLCLFAASSQQGLCLQRPRCGRCPIAEFCKHATRKITIKDLPSGERPRERLYCKGADVLSDHELVAIVIGGGTGNENALELSQRLISTFGSLQGIEGASNAELEGIKGIGKAKAARLKAALALGKRLKAPSLESMPRITGSRGVFEYYREKFSNAGKEKFLCLLLDSRHRVLREDTVAVGSLTESVVHPREVFKKAVRESAHAVLFVHNHPSGDPAPSPQDHELTRRLLKAGRIMGIKVLDHLIVGRDSYYSFAEHGGFD